MFKFMPAFTMKRTCADNYCCEEPINNPLYKVVWIGTIWSMYQTGELVRYEEINDVSTGASVCPFNICLNSRLSWSVIRTSKDLPELPEYKS